MTIAPWQTILDFWFLPPTDPSFGTSRREWFRKDAQFDADITTRFGSLIGQALAGGMQDWDAADPAHGALARILLLDQFTRNAYRDTRQAFGGDALALQAAQRMIDGGVDMALLPVQRWFAYMPFEHAEDIAMQDQAVALFNGLAAEFDGFESALDFAQRHRDVVARFGRFPHRNRILGRVSTPDEEAFLLLPGSRF